MSKKTTKTDEAELEPVMTETESADGLVKMLKGGDHLRVHPTTVAAHEDAGWQVA